MMSTNSTDVNRVTDVSYHDSDLDTAYTYDTATFAKSRLTGITRGHQTVAYGYDRFGRLTQDGALIYTWDKNGNRATIGYPEEVNATYAHDFADREQSLTVRVGANPPLQLVTGATYKPLEPLSGLSLGNGITEIRSFDARYFPAGIQVPGRLGWTYGTDAVGNILSISDTLNAANNRTYGYQDSQYFLTSGNGPWGARSWNYDRIGNRLTETRGAITNTYVYLSNGIGGNTPKIDRIIPRDGRTVRYTFDDAGNVLEDGRLSFSYGDDKRLTYSGTPKGGTTYTYDGRGFLSQSTLPLPEGLYDDYTVPTYNSEGLLLHRFARRNLQSGTQPTVKNSHLFVFYFAGRPVATLDKVTEGPQILESSSTTSTWQYLMVDHLGTPILIINPTGTQVWQGGFEPFGADYSAAATILRFPGQWDDATWSGNKDVGLYYNVHRWYQPGTGRYLKPDPLDRLTADQLLVKFSWADTERFSYFSYVHGNPINFSDPLGLLVFKGCDPVRKVEISREFKEYCAESGTPEFKNCMCDKPGIPAGLKSRCGNSNLVIRCESRSEGKCANCAWSVPFGNTIRVCPGAWEPICGPVGCTLLH